VVTSTSPALAGAVMALKKSFSAAGARRPGFGGAGGRGTGGGVGRRVELPAELRVDALERVPSRCGGRPRDC